jgi:hypothetical protein
MKALALAAAGVLIASTAALAQQPTGQGELMTSIPANNRTVTDWYKQNVYDQNNQKLGEIMDLLVNQSGQIEAAMVGVGGFLGAGEKDVAVSFNEIKPTKKNDKTYLTLNTTKDALTRHWALSTTNKARLGFPITERATKSGQAAN